MQSAMERLTLIQSILQELEEKRVQYCILRNYDFLLEGRADLKQDEKSIDMAVSRKDQAQFEAVLQHHGFLKRRPQFSLAHHAYFRIAQDDVQDDAQDDKEIGSLDIVSFDVQYGGVHWNDMCYLDEKELLGNRVKRENKEQKIFFYAPSIPDTYVMLLLHSLLGKRYFKPKYRQFLEEHREQAANPYVLEKVANAFNTALAKEILYSAGNGDFPALLRKKYFYITYFIFSSRKRIKTFIPLLFRWVRWKKFLAPSPLVSFIGPDGAGKTTLARGLHSCLLAQGRKASIVYTGRGKGQMLPVRKIGNMYKSKEHMRDAAHNTNANVNTNMNTNATQHAKKTVGRKLLYTIWSIVTAADLALRYAFLIFPRRRLRCWVITDRYTSDLLLMEHVPALLKRILTSFFPQPTLTFYAYNDAGVLHERRPQESLEGLQKQLRHFEEMQKRMGVSGSVIRIRTEDKEQSAGKVRKKVMEYAYRNWV